MRSPTRTLALDSLRGISILAMMFSGVIPWDGLPVWMYHGQEPPPSHDYNPNLPGITWVDLVFPFFLFAMGAAIPLAYKKRLAAGIPIWQLVLGALGRGLSLVAFAIFDQHIRPTAMANNPTTYMWQMGLFGFLIALPIWGMIPKSCPTWLKPVIRTVGVLLAAALITQLKYPDGVGFRIGRNDIILLVLAWMAAFGTIGWLLTRSSLVARLGLIAVILAWRIGATMDGSEASQIFWWDPIPWLGRPEFLHYLLIVLPGTIAGEFLLPKEEGEDAAEWPIWRNALLLLGSIAAIPLSLVTLHGRHSLAWLLPLALMLGLIQNPLAEYDRRLARIASFSLFWILVGTLMEPFQGGIKKDPVTLSYFFVSAGLAGLLLAGIMAFTRNWKWVPFSGVGQNPMLAYLAITNLVAPVWALAVNPFLGTAPLTTEVGVMIAVAKTALLAGFVSIMSRFRVTLRT